MSHIAELSAGAMDAPASLICRIPVLLFQNRDLIEIEEEVRPRREALGGRLDGKQIESREHRQNRQIVLKDVLRLAVEFAALCLIGR